jgi:CRP/FNR family transcriptional regulator, anaerobic regulatory protein
MSVPNGFVSCRDCPLRKSSAFTVYTDDEIAFVQAFKKTEVHLEGGAEVLAEGGQVRELYTLLSGIAFRFRTLRDGRRQILNFLFPGDLIGMQERVSSESPHGVETLSSARLCAFPSERLWDLYRQHPQLGYDVTWLTAHEEHIVDDNLLSVGRRSAGERMAMLLIHFMKRAEAVGLSIDGSVPFPVTQQHIADALGLSLVHTNKTLRRLEKLGLHKIENDRLRVIKPAALKRMADYYGAPQRSRPLI